jgi:VacB/RNase II family 3'-5' exoribonuclease
MSELPQWLAERGASVYFHGDVIPMLPEAIGQALCALAEDVVRPALVCQMQIAETGEIESYAFRKAIVRSHAKLTYSTVERYIVGGSDELIAHTNPLEALVQVYRKLREHREAHELVMETRKEYRWILDENKQIDSIERFEKMASQYLVEECMIAANKCAGRFLRDAGAPGPFVNHQGFRRDRLGEAKTFLQKHREDLAEVAMDTITGYRTVLADLGQHGHALPLRHMVNRLLSRAHLSQTAGPHMGLATEVYTNFTSPLRKALDFYVHLQMSACLADDPSAHYPVAQLAEITQSLGRSRAAVNAADRRLAANYLQKLKAAGQERFTGTVSHITSSGFTVKLDDSGLEGLVDLRAEAEKFSFDKWTMSLTSTTRRFQLAQAVEVTFVDAPAAVDFLSLFQLVEGCGMKPPKEPKADIGTTDNCDSEPVSDLTAGTAADRDASTEPPNSANP